MRVSFRLSALAVALAATAGCVLPDDVARLQQDVADVRNELAKVKAEQAAAAESAKKLEARLGTVDAVPRTEFADLKLQVDGFRRQMTALDERIAEAERRMDRVGQDVAASRELSKRAASQPPVGTSGPAPAASPAPESLYGQAYGDFSKGNWALAASGFEEYAERFPDSDQADNALYWIAECAFAQGRYADALQAYDRMLERYPRSEKAAAANLKKALALLEKNEVGKASAQLRYVVDTYPGTDEAKIATDRLTALGR